jgi:predicted RNA binding protein YcfA (HicA-like mRNA interferase family)
VVLARLAGVRRERHPAVVGTLDIASQLRTMLGVSPTSRKLPKGLGKNRLSHDTRQPKRGCREVRQKGSHLRIECANCVATVPVHAGEDIGPGLLRKIERDLEPCLGRGWLKRNK